MTLIDMSKMPKPDIVKPISFDTRLAEMLAAYTAGMRLILSDDTFIAPKEADPVYQVFAAQALILGLQDQRTNEACLANMLAYATGNDLANLGANVGIERIVIKAADASTNTAAVLENEERFRLRIQSAWESITTAGSVGAYRHLSLSADANVIDVMLDKPRFERVSWESLGLPVRDDLMILACTHSARLSNPIPGDIAITVLPAEDVDVEVVLGRVAAALNPLTAVPYTDTPFILQAEEILYDIIATLYFYPGPSAEPALAEAEILLWEYAHAQYRLGHDIAVSGLHAAAHRNGCQRVELNITNDIRVAPYQVARCRSVAVVMGGRDV